MTIFHVPVDSVAAITSPLARPLHFFGLELVVSACFALTVAHVLGAYRKGDRYPAFQWLVIFAYGVAMELIAFTFYRNYEHATFTVQLYRGQLPLYIPLVYIVFHYTGLKAIERLHLGALSEALLVGFAIALLDVPFDVVGVVAGWWSWSAADPNLTHRWLGVPVTSYYWYLVFGAVFALVSRALRRRVERRSLATYVALAPLVAVAIIALGIVAFLPFHLIVALGVGPGVLVAAHFAACGALALFVRSPRAEPAPRFVRRTAIVLPAWLLTVAVGLSLTPRTVVDGQAIATRVLAMLLAAAAALALVFKAARAPHVGRVPPSRFVAGDCASGGSALAPLRRTETANRENGG